MRVLSLALVLAVLALPLQAKEWIIDYANSKLTFTGMQAGQPFTGKFGVFLVSTDFDPARPDKSSLKVTIDMTSAQTGDAQRDAALPQKEWFDSKLYDKAEIFGARFRKIGERKFELAGKLDMKGKMGDIVFPFEMEAYNDGQHFTGSMVLKRTDYDVGTGEWLSDKFIGHDVRVDVSLYAYEKK